MANRNFANSRVYTGHVMPVMIDCNFSIGASGAVGTVKGPYVSSVTRLGVGAYQIKLQDNYNKFYAMDYALSAAVTGSALPISGGLTLGTSYIITSLGTSTSANFQAVGLPAGVTAAVGVGFVASTASAGTGTGAVKAIVSSGITAIELVGDQNLSMSPDPSVSVGAIIQIQCYGDTASNVTTQIPADPANGSSLELKFLLSNSSILIGGE